MSDYNLQMFGYMIASTNINNNTVYFQVPRDEQDRHKFWLADRTGLSIDKLKVTDRFPNRENGPLYIKSTTGPLLKFAQQIQKESFTIPDERLVYFIRGIVEATGVEKTDNTYTFRLWENYLKHLVRYARVVNLVDLHSDTWGKDCDKIQITLNIYKPFLEKLNEILD